MSSAWGEAAASIFSYSAGRHRLLDASTRRWHL